MKINSRIKYMFACFVFVMFLSLNAYSAERTSNSYAYIQINQMHNINSDIRGTSWVLNSDTQQLDKNRNRTTFSILTPSFMSNFTAGYMFNDKYGVELEYASYDMFTYKLNGDRIGNGFANIAVIRVEYVFFNFRQDFFEYKDINMFYKLGFGFVQPNYASMGNVGGSNLEIGLQGDLGAYYSFTDFIDFEVFYKILGNYARSREMYAFSYRQKTRFMESSINWSIRFKFHSFNKKYGSLY